MRRSKPDRLTQLALGAAGGFVGTVALTAVLQTTMKWLPQTAPPLREEPGKFMVHKAEDALPANVRASIPRPLENAAARLLAIGYGITFGALYAALRPRGVATVGVYDWLRRRAS